MSTMRVMSPLGEVQAQKKELAPRLETLEGKNIGFLDDQLWQSMDIAFEILEAELKEQYGAAGVVRRLKPAGYGLKKDELDEFASQVDAVITGLGN